LQARKLNLDNKPYDVDGNELVFALKEADAGASDSSYLDLNTEDEEPAIELKKWILNAIKL
jgi:hypothetical protein